MTLISFSRSLEDFHNKYQLMSSYEIYLNIIGAGLRADYVLVTLTSFSRSQEELDDKVLYPRYLLNQLMDFPQTCIDTPMWQA